ncbi:MAG: GtrA family protein [Candidatus Hodarchaeota archaeon]
MTFSIVGLSGMAVGLGILNLCMFLWHNFPLANIAAFIGAVTWNFLLNRRVTFKSTEKRFFRQWLEFVIACLGAAMLNWTVSLGLYYNLLFFSQHYNCAAIAGVAAGSIFNFFASRSYVFKRRKIKCNFTPNSTKKNLLQT